MKSSQEAVDNEIHVLVNQGVVFQEGSIVAAHLQMHAK